LGSLPWNFPPLALFINESWGFEMKHKLLHEAAGQRTFIVVLDTGEEVVSCLQRFAESEHIYAGQITGIGAFSDVGLMYFDWETKAYVRIPVCEQVEVASLQGDIACSQSGQPSLHIHLVVGKRNGAAMAGHLGEAHVRPTLEVIITESPSHLRKVKDAESGLALIDLIPSK
jgi:uncharacterized protein